MNVLYCQLLSLFSMVLLLIFTLVSAIFAHLPGRSITLQKVYPKISGLDIQPWSLKHVMWQVRAGNLFILQAGGVYRLSQQRCWFAVAGSQAQRKPVTHRSFSSVFGMRAATGFPDFFTKSRQQHAKSSPISHLSIATRRLLLGRLCIRVVDNSEYKQLGPTDRLRIRRV